jgi:ABC-2 type transport system ATP-binding protein
MAIIEVEHLIKRYTKAEVNAVDDISFQVQAGEFFCLLGPNGAGKTTTISILTTTRQATSGRVQIAGYDANSQASEVRSQIGIIFQNPSLDLNLTAEENVRFHAVLYGLYTFRPFYALMPQAYKDKIEELAHVLGIEKEMFKPVKTFSGGMKRKLEIIRSLIHNPKVLFLDEPTTGLDPLSRRNLWDYLGKVRAETDTTVFLTTHYLEEAEAADQVCIIDHGKITAMGTPEQLKARFTERYLLIEAEDRAPLLHELGALAYGFREQGPYLRVELNGQTAHAMLKTIQTPLSYVHVHSQTLEDAYLAIVEKSEHVSE